MGRVELFIMNPSCEMAIASGVAAYTPPKQIALFEQLIEQIPIWFISSSSYLLVERCPSTEYIDSLTEILGSTPNFITPVRLRELTSQGLDIDIKLWGLTPAIEKGIQSITKRSGVCLNQPKAAQWCSTLRNFVSRHFALEILTKSLERVETFSNLRDIVSVESLPNIAYSIDEIESFMKQNSSSVLKSPWSSSGRGVMFVKGGNLEEIDKRWCSSVLKLQDSVMVEHRLERVIDFSLHFDIVESGAVNYVGLVSFNTDLRGNYNGSNIEALPKSFIEETALTEDIFNRVANDIVLPELVNSGIGDIYSGSLGVDGIVYRSEVDGSIKINPCLEINVRESMGRVTLSLRDKLAEGAAGVWSIERLGAEIDPIAYDCDMRMRYPLQFSDRGEVKSGYFPMVEPTIEQSLAVYAIVE